MVLNMLKLICAYSHIIFIYLMFGMHKPRRFVIKCKPNVSLCTMSIWVGSDLTYQLISIFSSIFLFINYFVYLINYILYYLLLYIIVHIFKLSIITLINYN